MNTYKNLLHLLKICFCILLLPFLLNCGSDDEKTESEAKTPIDTLVETPVAIKAANSNISQIIRTSASATAGVGADSEAIASLLEPLGVTLAVNDEDGGISDNIIKVMQSVLDETSTNINREDDVITIEPEGQPICDEFSLLMGFSDEDDTYSTCLNVINDMLVKIIANNDQSGDISVHYDGFQAINVSYSPNQLVVSVNLTTASQTLQQVMQVIDPEVELELPETISGGIAVTLKNLGDQHGSMQLDISDTVQIIDSNDGYNIKLEPATLLSVTANGLTGTAKISSTINELTGDFPMDIDDGNTAEAKLLINSSEIDISVADAGETLELKVNIEPIKLTMDSVEILSLALSVPQMKMTDAMSMISMSSPMKLTLAVFDDYDLLGGTDGDVTITSSENTVLEDQGESTYLVKSGGVDISGTGSFAELSSLIESDSCLNLGGKVDCPEQGGMD